MITSSLRIFTDSTIERGDVSEQDVDILRRDLFADGITSRDEADVLIALDRAIAVKHASWANFLVGQVVAFTVWTSRPTGKIDAETARWLTTSLSCGQGPTPTAIRIAFEVVREAEQADETLVAFVLRGVRGCAKQGVGLAA